jgi:FkbM family methyltransferase
MFSCTFSNDEVSFNLPIGHEFSNKFKTRNDHEVYFRKVHTYLLKNGYIKNNIIDLGAWIGDNSIPWCKNTNKIIYAIDPSHNNCEFIRLVASMNDINNIKIINTAISDKCEVLRTSHNIDHCSFVWSEVTDKMVEINAYSLDNLLNTQTIEDIGYMHLDVEGMEYRIILGATNLINRFKPIITFEQHIESENYMAIVHHLEQIGYKCYLINEISIECSHDCRNILSLPNTINENDVNKILSDINNIREGLLIKL